jgi:hypothetical protein
MVKVVELIANFFSSRRTHARTHAQFTSALVPYSEENALTSNRESGPHIE